MSPRVPCFLCLSASRRIRYAAYLPLSLAISAGSYQFFAISINRQEVGLTDQGTECFLQRGRTRGEGTEGERDEKAFFVAHRLVEEFKRILVLLLLKFALTVNGELLTVLRAVGNSIIGTLMRSVTCGFKLTSPFAEISGRVVPRARGVLRSSPFPRKIWGVPSSAWRAPAYESSD